MTTLTFDTGQGANDDLSSTFGSNLSSSIDGAMISGIGTPDISLAWTAATNVLKSIFLHIGIIWTLRIPVLMFCN